MGTEKEPGGKDIPFPIDVILKDWLHGKEFFTGLEEDVETIRQWFVDHNGIDQEDTVQAPTDASPHTDQLVVEAANPEEDPVGYEASGLRLLKIHDSRKDWALEINYFRNPQTYVLEAEIGLNSLVNGEIDDTVIFPRLEAFHLSGTELAVLGYYNKTIINTYVNP